MLLKRRAMMFRHSSAPQRRLPYDYQELAYIESTGTQYIDTGINLNATTDATEIDYMSLKAEGVSFQVPIGSSNTSNGGDSYHFYIGSTNNISVCNGKRDATSIGVLWGDGERHVAKITHDGIYLNNSFYPITSENINQDYSCFVLARNTAGTVAAQCTGRAYRATIYRNGIEIRNLVPAMRYSDKKAGMYDIVNDVFYTNQGTGEFKMGPWVPYRLPDDFQEVEYIGNTSRSYINTGYKPNINSEVELTYNYYSYGTQSGNQLLGAQNTTNGAQALIMGSTLQSASVGVGKWVCLHQTSTTSNYNFDGGYANDYNKHTWYLDKSKIIYDNVTYSWETTPNLTSQINYPLYLFARNNVGNVYPASGNFALINVYELKISESGVSKSDLIPCYRISDGTIGMYDTVSNTFKTNSGTGTFTKGPNLPKRLPDEYQEVSYIGTSDTTSKTHIDTGVVLQSVFTINARVLWHRVLTTGAYQYHGHYSSSSSVQFGAMSNTTHYISSTTGADALASDIAVAANTVYSIQLKADGSTSTFTVNGSTVTGNYTFSATNPYTSFIFGRNGNKTHLNTWVDGKVYSYDISKDNILVRYYVPCYRKADNAIGLYDLCGSVCSLTGTSFYTNAGSGTFTKGADV